MSRGGRGRTTGGVAMLASALGIQRNEFNKAANAVPPPTLFPTLNCKPLPLTSNSDWDYMVESKQEFLRRIHDSPYHLRPKAPKADVDRYSDKYKKRTAEPWVVNWARLPRILWPKGMTSSVSKAHKKTKIDKSVELSEALAVLEEKERAPKAVDKEQSSSEVKEKVAEEDVQEKKDEEEELSDEDYQEEDNDYIQNYFDNGEEYLDESGDDLDGGEAVY